MTPSTEPRRWYHSGEGAHERFRHRYDAAPAAPDAAELLTCVRDLARRGRVAS